MFKFKIYDKLRVYVKYEFKNIKYNKFKINKITRWLCAKSKPAVKNLSLIFWA